MDLNVVQQDDIKNFVWPKICEKKKKGEEEGQPIIKEKKNEKKGANEIYGHLVYDVPQSRSQI